MSSLSGAKAPLVFPAGEERNGEDSRDQSSPGLGASAAEWGGVEGPGELGRKEKNGASPSAVDTSGVRGDWTQKGASGSSQKNERRPQNRVPECRWGTEDVHPVPVLVPRAQRRQRVGSRSRGQSVSLKVLGVQPVSHVRRMPISVPQPQSIPGPNVQPMPISVPRAQPMPIPVPRVQSVPVTVPPSQPMPISMPHVQPVAYSLSHVQPVHIPLHHVQSLPTHVSQALPMPVPVPHVQPGPITVPHAHPIPLPVPHVQPLPFPVPLVQSVPVRVPYIQTVPVTVPLTQPMPVPVPQAQSMPVTVPHMQPMQIDVPQTQPMPAPVSSAQHRAVNEPSIPHMPVPGELPTSVLMACDSSIPIAVPPHTASFGVHCTACASAGAPPPPPGRIYRATAAGAGTGFPEKPLSPC